jgi:5-methylcytosine-specific restriction endonuclease McrA
MPSSPGYKRNYKQEYASEDKGRRQARSQRNQARQEMIKQGKAKVGDGKDVGHKKAISKGGSNSLTNLAMQSPSANRSFSRKSSGAMASETSKKEARRKK